MSSIPRKVNGGSGVSFTENNDAEYTQKEKRTAFIGESSPCYRIRGNRGPRPELVQVSDNSGGGVVKKSYGVMFKAQAAHAGEWRCKYTDSDHSINAKLTVSQVRVFHQCQTYCKSSKSISSMPDLLYINLNLL